MSKGHWQDSLALLRPSIDPATGNFYRWRRDADLPSVTQDGQRLRRGFPGRGADALVVQRPASPQPRPQESTPSAAPKRPFQNFASEDASAEAERQHIEDQIVQWADSEAPYAGASDIAFMLWSMSAVGSKNMALADALIVRANSQAREFSTTQLTMAMSAIADIGIIPRALAAKDLLHRVEVLAGNLSRRKAGETLRALHKSGLSRQLGVEQARRAVAALQHRLSSV